MSGELAQKRMDAAIMRNRRRIEETQQLQLAKELSRYFLSMVGRLRLPTEKNLQYDRIQMKVRELKESTFPDPGALLDWRGEEAALSKIVHKAYLNVGEDVRKGVQEAIGVVVDFGSPAEFDKAVLKDVGAGIKGINIGTRSAVAGTIRRGLAEGASTQAIAKQLKNQIQGWGGGPAGKTIAHSRAMVVARTETAIAYNTNAILSYEKSGIIKQAKCLDAPTCGWTSHEDPDIAAGKIVTLDEAKQHPVSHPNCVRAFAPVVAKFADEAAKPKPTRKLSAAEDAEEQLYSLDVEKNRVRDLMDKADAAGDRDGRRKLAQTYQTLQELSEKQARRLTSTLPAAYKKFGYDDLTKEVNRLQSLLDNDGGYGIKKTVGYLKLGAAKEIQDLKRIDQPWAKRVVFDGPEETRPYFNRLNKLGPEIEATSGVKSRWTGKMTYEPDAAGRGAAAWAHMDGSLINLTPAAGRYAQKDLDAVLIHELYHTMSGGTKFVRRDAYDYAQWAGWEEGVVEKMKRLTELRATNAAVAGYQAYGPYTEKLDRITSFLYQRTRESGKTSLSLRAFEEEVYTGLINQPVAKRAQYMKDRITAIKGDPDAFKSEFDYLAGANRLVKERHGI